MKSLSQTKPLSVCPTVRSLMIGVAVLLLISGCGISFSRKGSVAANMGQAPNLEYQKIRVYQVKGATSTQTLGVNDLGEGVGTYYTRIGRFGGARFSPDWFWTDYPSNGTAANHYPSDVNNLGDIVGTLRDPYAKGYIRKKTDPFGRVEEILYPEARDTSVIKINDQQLVAGNYYSEGRFGAFLWKDGQFEDVQIDGAEQVSVLALNNLGDVVLGVDSKQVLRRQSGEVQKLDHLPDSFSVKGVSDTGELVGMYLSETYTEHGFYQNAAGQLFKILIPEAQGVVPTDISGTMISGYFYFTNNPLDRQGFVIEL